MSIHEISQYHISAEQAEPLSSEEALKYAYKRSEKVKHLVREAEGTGESKLVGFTEVMPGSENTVLVSTGIAAASDPSERYIGTVFQSSFQVPQTDLEIIKESPEVQNLYMESVLKNRVDIAASIRFGGWDSTANCDNPAVRLLFRKWNENREKLKISPGMDRSPEGGLLQISAPGVIGADFTLRKNAGDSPESVGAMMERAEELLLFLNNSIPDFSDKLVSAGGHSMSGHMFGNFVRRIIKDEPLFKNIEELNTGNLYLGIIAPVVAVREVPEWIKKTGVDVDSHLLLFNDFLLRGISASPRPVQDVLMHADMGLLKATNHSLSGWRIARYVDNYTLDYEETRAYYTFNLDSNYRAVQAQSNTLSAFETVLGDYTQGLVDPGKLENIALVAPEYDQVLTPELQREYFEQLLGSRIYQGIKLPQNYFGGKNSGHCPSRSHWERYFDWLIPKLTRRQHELEKRVYETL